MSRHFLSIEDRQNIGEKLNSIDLHLSEFCFPNLYFFRKTHEYEVIQGKEAMYIAGLSYDQKRYIMPLHSPGEDPEYCYDFLEEEMRTGNYDMIFPVPESWLQCLPEDRFKWEYHSDDSDYLYLTSKMVELKGKKLQKKRNLISQFQREWGEPEVWPLTEETLNPTIDILEKWQDAYPDEINVSDYCQCREALHDRRGFGLSGAIFYAKGQPAGFILGEALNKETFTVHFAKGLTMYKGIYPLMFSRFCRDYLQSYTYMNMEQDLGKPGLRQTKRSYAPDLMAHKYRVTLQ